jgi:hypothetical protein
MFRTFGTVCGLALASLSVSSALALGPVGGQSPASPANAQEASFFGRPYPYGYTGWSPCFRYVEVQTRHGVRVRRVWVCR